MITRTYEWLIAAKFKPDNATVEIRQKIAAELLKSFDDGKDAATLVNYCVAACAGCKHGFTSESPFIKKLVETIRKHQAAYPTDLNDNALDIQVLCAVVIGELLSRSKIPNRDFASAAASLIVSTLGFRSAAAGKYAVGFLNELQQIALKYLANRAESVREREEPSIDDIKEIEAGADLPAFWEELQTQLVDTLHQLNSNAQTDREELEVLWWFYKRESKLSGKRISELPINVAALIGAVEVADSVILPPHQGTIAMLWDAVSESKPKTDLAKHALKTSIADWDATSVDLFLQDSEEYTVYIKNNAAAFPLSWICLRLKESDYASTWDQEFEFLHLALDGKHLPQRRVELLLSDLPGEWSSSLINRSDVAARFEFLTRADAVALVVDGPNLTNDSTRHTETINAKHLLNRLANNVNLPRDVKLLLVVSKFDQLDALPRDLEKIRSEAEQLGFAPQVIPMAAFSRREQKVPHGQGLLEFVDAITEPCVINRRVIEPSTATNSYRSFTRPVSFDELTDA